MTSVTIYTRRACVDSSGEREEGARKIGIGLEWQKGRWMHREVEEEER